MLQSGFLQHLTEDFHYVKVSPADDLGSLVASIFCISHPDAHSQLQKVDRLPVEVLQWWTQAWMTRPQWRLALEAARAASYDILADCSQK